MKKNYVQQPKLFLYQWPVLTIPSLACFCHYIKTNKQQQDTHTNKQAKQKELEQNRSKTLFITLALICSPMCWWQFAITEESRLVSILRRMQISSSQ